MLRDALAFPELSAARLVTSRLWLAYQTAAITVTNRGLTRITVFNESRLTRVIVFSPPIMPI